VAQTSPVPAVHVLRDLRIDQSVWPADMNRDGVTDLLSSSDTTFNNGTPSRHLAPSSSTSPRRRTGRRSRTRDRTWCSRGSDIWGTADAFAYLWTSTAAVAESTLITRVVSIDNTDVWAKAGVMFRESLAPGAPHVFAMVTPGKGLSLQYRSATGGQRFVAASRPGIAPRWLKLQRAGNTFTASDSIDGVTFVQFGTATVVMAESATVGLAATMHNSSTAGAARFDKVQLIQPGFQSQ
jgi:hypothetical protein